jgi:hypothetical protein
MSTLNTTELDFKKIKDNIKSYFRNSSDFTDYDFEGSGLNHVLDVLAYNTHYNAINAHMAVNESFIDSAQVRANVVSHAKLVGYVPSSVAAPRARINFTLKYNGSGTAPTTVELPSGSQFTTSVGGVTYSFETLADVISSNVTTNDAGEKLYEFNDLEIVEGKKKTNKFIFNNSQNEKFVIPDNNIDKSTLKVIVKDSETATTSITYTPFDVEADINSDSTIYYITENYEGYYEIQFGNDILGNKPEANSVITTEHLSSNALAANGATTFTFADSYPIDTTLKSISTASNAAGGAERETIESIQFNAPRSFISQNRAVTTDDYAIQVRGAINDVQDVSVYGGDTLTPPQYGKVFISVKPQGSLYLTQTQKQAILDRLESKRIVTVTPVIVDADYTYLYFNVYPKYNSSLTSLTENQMNTAIRNKIGEFNDTFLQSYGNNFRYSKFLSTLDTTEPSIQSTSAQVYVYKKVVFDPSTSAGQSASFGFQLLGDVDQEGSFITTTSWVYQGKTYYLDDIPITGSNERRQIRRFYINQNNVKVVEDANVGTLYPLTGRIQVNNQPADIRSEVDITVLPISYDIPGVENKLLTIDLARTNVFADSRLKVAGGSIVPTNYVSAPKTESTTSSSVAFSSSGNFVPHTMYDPNTGIAYYAATEALHLEYAARGYVHYIPTITTAQQQTTQQAATSAPLSYSDQQMQTGSGTSSQPASGGGSGQGQSQPDPTPPSGGSYGY